ncbi:MAG: SPOR domain-containing protein [Armatimonadetes bacterium]|nr:SPOR domain-containing protein [Armatimonadota bacterium]
MAAHKRDSHLRGETMDTRLKVLGFLGFTVLAGVLFCVGLFLIGPAMRTHFTPSVQPTQSRPVYNPQTPLDQQVNEATTEEPSAGSDVDVEITERSNGGSTSKADDIPAAKEDGLRQDRDSLTVQLEPVHERRVEPQHEKSSSKSDSTARPNHEPENSPSVERPRVATEAGGRVSSNPSSSHSYKVQTGTFANRANAETLVDDLRAKGYKAEIKTVQVEDRTLHRVQVGAYKTREDAQELANDLSAEGYSATVVDEKAN